MGDIAARPAAADLARYVGAARSQRRRDRAGGLMERRVPGQDYADDAKRIELR